MMIVGIAVIAPFDRLVDCRKFLADLDDLYHNENHNHCAYGINVESHFLTNLPCTDTPIK